MCLSIKQGLFYEREWTSSQLTWMCVRGTIWQEKKKKSAYFVCVQISLSIMAAVLMLPVSGSILNKPLMDDDLIE